MVIVVGKSKAGEKVRETECNFKWNEWSGKKTSLKMWHLSKGLKEVRVSCYCHIFGNNHRCLLYQAEGPVSDTSSSESFC